MNILVVSQYFHPENFRVNDLVDALKEKGHNVTVLTGVPNYPYGKIFDGYKFSHSIDSYNGVKVIRVPLIPRGEKSKIGLMLNYLSFPFFAMLYGPWLLRKEKVDKIFVYCVSPIFQIIPAIFFKYIKKAALAVWIQDLWPESVSATGMIKNKFAIKLIGYITSFIYYFSDLILISSKAFTESIQKHDYSKSPIEYFPQWGEKIFEEKSKNDSIDLNKIYPSGFKVVFAGNIGVAQKLDTVVKAINELKQYEDIKLVLVGDGRDKKNLMKLVKTLDLEDRVFFPGSFPLETMPTFFQNADALYFGLKKDKIFSLTVPGKLQAYMASGKPILTAIDGISSTLVDEAKAGFTTGSENYKELADNILKLYKLSHDEKVVLGHNSENYYKNNFRRPDLISKLEDLLSGIDYKKRM